MQWLNQNSAKLWQKLTVHVHTGDLELAWLSDGILDLNGSSSIVNVSDFGHLVCWSSSLLFQQTKNEGICTQMYICFDCKTQQW